MAWDDYARTRLAASKSCPTEMAVWIRDRDRMLAELPFHIEVASSNTTNASFTAVANFRIYVTTPLPGNYTLHLHPRINGNGEIRLVDNSTGTAGSAVAFNVVSLQELGSTVQLDIASGWAVGQRQIDIELKATSGTVTVENADRMTGKYEAT